MRVFEERSRELKVRLDLIRNEAQTMPETRRFCHEKAVETSNISFPLDDILMMFRRGLNVDVVQISFHDRNGSVVSQATLLLHSSSSVLRGSYPHQLF